ncbi:MAG: type II toxin-antitoxin system PemK/MazF family toxin, partial [Verrucomicrobiaceae bacterium]|nr:type II toxin-antitoxin system PemK/MazF family toxin [Verrucomicrobiaceae bacterium]
MPARYVPDRGDVVWLEFDPQAGHEQAGHRPAVVLSPRAYNQKNALPLIGMEISVPWVGSIQADRSTGRDVEIGDPQLDGLSWAQIASEMHMALPGIDERLAGGISTGSTCGVFRGIQGELTG